MSLYAYFHNNVYRRHEINKEKNKYISRAEREGAQDQSAGARNDVRCCGYGAELEGGKKGKRRVIKNTDDDS